MKEDGKKELERFFFFMYPHRHRLFFTLWLVWQLRGLMRILRPLTFLAGTRPCEPLNSFHSQSHGTRIHGPLSSPVQWRSLGLGFRFHLVKHAFLSTCVTAGHADLQVFSGYSSLLSPSLIISPNPYREHHPVSYQTVNSHWYQEACLPNWSRGTVQGDAEMNCLL